MWLYPASAFASDDIEADWTAVAPTVAARSAVPIPFTGAELAALVGSKPIARRFDTPDGAFAVGAVWVAAPIEDLWVVLQDAMHDAASPGPSRLTQRRLTAGVGPEQTKQVYMHLDLPYPLTDRQWVVVVSTNAPLYQATGGQVWQRRWVLGDPASAGPPGSATGPDPDATWLPDTRGAWTLLESHGGTVVQFSVRTVLGGLVPSSIAQGWAVSTVRGALERVAARATSLPGHYDAAHEVVYAPDGAPIPPR
ncbi:MAG: hypothetical protein ABMB14_38760 [Myxococcota bacterium]